jgi:hypothetical protein
MTTMGIIVAGTAVFLLMIGVFAYLTRSGARSKTNAGTPPSAHGTDHDRRTRR